MWGMVKRLVVSLPYVLWRAHKHINNAIGVCQKGLRQSDCVRRGTWKCGRNTSVLLTMLSPPLHVPSHYPCCLIVLLTIIPLTLWWLALQQHPNSQTDVHTQTRRHTPSSNCRRLAFWTCHSSDFSRTLQQHELCTLQRPGGGKKSSFQRVYRFFKKYVMYWNDKEVPEITGREKRGVNEMFVKSKQQERVNL